MKALGVQHLRVCPRCKKRRWQVVTCYHCDGKFCPKCAQPFKLGRYMGRGRGFFCPHCDRNIVL